MLPQAALADSQTVRVLAAALSPTGMLGGYPKFCALIQL